MIRLCDILIALVISIEMIVILCGVAAYFSMSSEIQNVGSQVAAGPDVIKWLALLPAVLLGLVGKDYGSILFPDGPLGQAFQDWPQYHMVWDRYFITVAFLLVCAIITIGLWVTTIDFSDPISFLFFFGSILLSIVTYWHFFFAKITLRRLLATVK